MRFLLIDRVLEFEPDRRLAAIKNVTLESLYFEHHFPQFPVFPGVLIIEAMAQASGYFLTRSIEEIEGCQNVFAMMTASNTRFLKSVRPGDQIRLETELIVRESSMARTRATATVESEVVCRSEFSFALIEDRGESTEGIVLQWRTLRRVLEHSESEL